ncbi:unnamed protein product, partial [Adineta steineri]
LNYVNYGLLLETQYHFYWDFRHTAYGFFAMLRTLCASAKQTINDQLISFYSTVLLTDNAISQDIFLANINATRDQFIATSANDFIITLDSVILMASANVNVNNRLGTFWRFSMLFAPYNQVFLTWASEPYPNNGDCSHQTTLYCITTTGIYLRKLPNET